MNFLIISLLLIHLPLAAQDQDKEADLQLPVTEVKQIQKQEEKLPPTIYEVEMTKRPEEKEVPRAKKKEKIQ